MLNKLIVYFIIVFFGISIALNAQTTPDKKTPKFTEKDIRISKENIAMKIFHTSQKLKSQTHGRGF
jgi:preprotein translocase subunit SecG